MVHVGESDTNRELTALHGPAILSGQFSRENTVRDVLEMVMGCRDVEFGLFRILSKDLRGYFGVSRGTTIIGGYTSSTREYGIPALRELLAASRGMFIFAQLQEFPIEVRQSLSIPVKDLLEWRPEGVPPNLVPLLSQALAPWEHAQAALEASECMDALRFGTMPAPVDADQEEANFIAFWGGKAGPVDDSVTPAKPLSALLPKAEMPKAPQHPMAVTVEILPQPVEANETGEDGNVRQEVAATWVPQPRPATPPGSFAQYQSSPNVPAQPAPVVAPAPPMMPPMPAQSAPPESPPEIGGYWC
jgi:hypothetical protein